MQPKAQKKKRKRASKGFTKTSKQTEPQSRTRGSYNIIAVVHSKFSSLVSSKTVYSLRYSPEARYNNR